MILIAQKSDYAGRSFRYASLYEADIAGSDCRGADFRHADLRNANLADCNLEEAVLTNARYGQGTIWPTGFDPNTARAVSVEVEEDGAATSI
jgi:uncharacterized protein YjbI with pentapeptide repeats